MKAKAPKRAMLAIFLLISQALAVHLMKIIDVAEYVERRVSQPEENLSLLRVDAKPQKAIIRQLNLLMDNSRQVVGPCHDLDGVCDAPPYPLFPFSDGYRNALLQRPPPDVVRANIEKATNGELSTVKELVERVNVNLRNGSLHFVSDNELTLLATNFAEPEAGFVVRVACGPAKYDVWAEDLLVSQDEQRALLAGWLYAMGDDMYLSRRNAAEQQHQDRLGVDSSCGDECKSSVDVGLYRFLARVEQLDAEVVVTETEWLAWYDEYVAALRAFLWNMVPSQAYESEDISASLENLISAAEDQADVIIEGHVPSEEPGYRRFLAETRRAIEHEFPEFRPGMVQRLAYRRWKMLSA